MKKADITPKNTFLFDNSVELSGEALRSGDHKIAIRRTGNGPLYYSALLQYFTQEERITRSGLEVKVDRKYYRLQERNDAPIPTADKMESSQNQAKRMEKYDRILLADGAEIRVGDLIEVVLTVESKNRCDSILIEDRKIAGLEPVHSQSGYQGETYVEYRNDRVCFFIHELPAGVQTMTYSLRAEQPGRFSALPAVIWGMYSPELRGNSDEFKLKISD